MTAETKPRSDANRLKKTPAAKRGRPGAGSVRPQPHSAFLVYDFLGRQYQLPLLEGEDNETKERILIFATIMFAQRGYAAISVRDIARVNGVKASSLYNHFESKEALWAAALEHLKKLYFLYFEILDQNISRARSFEETLALVLHEPKKMTNSFTTYGFSLILTEQINNPLAAETHSSMLNYGINFIQEKFDACVAKGWVAPFDTHQVSALIMNSVYMGFLNKVQEYEGRPIVTRTEDLMAGLELFLLSATGAKMKPAQPLVE